MGRKTVAVVEAGVTPLHPGVGVRGGQGPPGVTPLPQLMSAASAGTRAGHQKRLGHLVLQELCKEPRLATVATGPGFSVLCMA